MRENKGTNRLVCDAMLKIAKNNLTQKSTDSDLACLFVIKIRLNYFGKISKSLLQAFA